jgi:hypothetical protein
VHSNGVTKTDRQWRPRRTLFNGINTRVFLLLRDDLTIYVPEISSLEAACSLLPVLCGLTQKKNTFFPSAIKPLVFRGKQKSTEVIFFSVPNKDI